ncbi:MAG: EI24 domain-containing protein [Alphaproteobacteria bacterium]|jgi:CysZ protein|nr:EI24 domain-containing protein [Alphaproteobacteria bacterium]MBP9878162.1 EI24 domain-containing protein [Alphaproteobacteria bacterium]
MQIFLRSLSQLFDLKILTIIFKSIFLAVLVFIISIFLLHSSLKYLIELTTDNQWFSYLSYIGDIGFLGLSVFLFPAVFIFVSSFYFPQVMNRVEKVYYPSLKANESALHVELWSALKLFLLVLFVNLLALPFYIIPVINIFVYFAVNGFLLGREYFEMAALRYYEPGEIKRLHVLHRTPKFMLGLCFAFLGWAPLVNLLSPTFAVLLMSHYVCGIAVKKDSN